LKNFNLMNDTVPGAYAIWKIHIDGYYLTVGVKNIKMSNYCIRQIIQGGKLSQFSRNFAVNILPLKFFHKYQHCPLTT